MIITVAIRRISLIIWMWAVFSLFASGVKVNENACGRTYPIDRVFYTNAFCEIQVEED